MELFYYESKLKIKKNIYYVLGGGRDRGPVREVEGGGLKLVHSSQRIQI